LEFLRRTPSLANPRVLPVGGAGEMHWDIAWTSAGVAVAGMALAAFFYLGDRREVDWIARRIAPLYQLSYGKFFFDEIYAALVVWPLWLAAIATYAVDRWIVDGLVDAVGRIPPAVGSLMRPLQNGLVQFYALAMMLGLLVLAIVMLG
jgi:NADH-quinone oxidoreductase subunit L